MQWCSTYNFSKLVVSLNVFFVIFCILFLFSHLKFSRKIKNYMHMEEEGKEGMEGNLHGTINLMLDSLLSYKCLIFANYLPRVRLKTSTILLGEVYISNFLQDQRGRQ